MRYTLSAARLVPRRWSKNLEYGAAYEALSNLITVTVTVAVAVTAVTTATGSRSGWIAGAS